MLHNPHPFFATTETHAVLVTLTVDEMKNILTNWNHFNRPVSKSRVDAIRSDIQNNRYNKLAGNCIKFNRNGFLTDGGHRLAAFVAENKPMTVSIIYGLPNDAILYQDDVRPRAASHNAHLSVCIDKNERPDPTKQAYTNQMYSFARDMARGLKWKAGESNPRQKMSSAAQREFVEKHFFTLTFLSDNATSVATKRIGFAGAMGIFFQINPKKALKFMKEMRSGVTKSEVIITLRDYLNQKKQGGDSTMNDHFNTIHAINCYCLNKKFKVRFPHNTRPSWQIEN
jgi:hypothetical protein